MNKSLLIFTIFFVTCVDFCFMQDQLEEFCNSVTSTIRCNSADQYRKINGRCNNVNRPFAGAASTKLTRLISPRYSDGLSEPPVSVLGSDLPSARLISTTCFGDKSVADTKLTLTAMNFAHFLTHDMTLGIGNTNVNGCCQERTLVSNPDAHCFPIPIPSGDPIHTREGCLNFNRNLFDISAGCTDYKGDGFAQQLNRVTSFLDLSVVYGNNNVDLAKIRSYKDGKMTVETRNGATWPPENSDKSVCNVETPTETCYVGGDRRMNQTPHLTIMHILFLREHNRIADTLKSLNPTWDDDKLYEEARRINIAQYQYITYYEFLPQILGLDNMKKAGLYVYDQGSSYVNDYDSNADPSVINEFTGTAFRYFHTMIKGTLNLLNEQRGVKDTARLSDVLNRPVYVEKDDNFQSFTRGMATQASEARDANLDPEIQTYLFRKTKQYGDDLKSFDIQRDRDHGIGSYNDMRVAAGLSRANSFDDLLDVISPTNVENLKKVYSNVNDIDLSVGGDLENPRDSTVGHGTTYHYILMKQFTNTRTGDRFWFESSTSPYPFTGQQLPELRKSSMSRIICDNSNGVELMQPNSFVIANSGDNAYVGCSSIPTVELSYWKA